MPFLRFSFLAVCLSALLAAPAFAQDAAAHHVDIKLTPEKTVVEPNDPLLIAVAQTIEQGWHTYWTNPGDSGVPMKITWTMPPGFVLRDLHWPVPHRISTGGLTSYGYEGQATMLQEIEAPAELPPGPLTFTAKTETLVCREICIPETGTYSFTINKPGDTPETMTDNTALIDQAYGRLPQAIDWDSSFRERDGVLMVMVGIERHGLLNAIDLRKGIDIIPYEWGVVDNNSGARSGIRDEQTLIVHKRCGERSLKDFDKLRLLLAYTDKSGNPAALEVVSKNDPDKKALTRAMPGSAESLGLALFFAFAGGLVLNLMPCVFPILSMKALSLCALPDKEQRKARLQGVAYTLGILVSFAVIAGLLIGLRATGMRIGWGFQLQDPSFVLLLCYVLFVIGLNLSGFFEIGGRLAGWGSKLTKGSGFAGSFFTGVLATLVATPCTAPFMGAAVAFALSHGAALAMAVFLTLGLGLAAPYLILSLAPACHAWLPRPGAWMNTFRQFLAFPMYASAAWLVWVYSQQAGSDGVAQALGGLIAVSFAIWAFRAAAAHAGAGRFLVRALAALALLMALAPVLPQPHSAEMRDKAMEKTAWKDFTLDDFTALEAGDDSLFVDMTAAWCITCKVNERVALDTAETQKLFAEQGVVAIRGDWTSRNPEITDYLAGFKRNGVPLYVFYGPRDKQTHKRPAPVVLPQILTPGIVKDYVMNPKKEEPAK
jgi:thiol:disulfide interchange protein DsbD